MVGYNATMVRTPADNVTARECAKCVDALLRETPIDAMGPPPPPDGGVSDAGAALTPDLVTLRKVFDRYCSFGPEVSKGGAG